MGRREGVTNPRFTQLSHEGTGECIDGSRHHEDEASHKRSQVELTQMRFKSRSIESNEVERSSSRRCIQQGVPITQEAVQTAGAVVRSVHFARETASEKESGTEGGNRPEAGRAKKAMTPPANSKLPRTANGSAYPAAPYSAPPTVGPRIRPNPKQDSNSAFAGISGCQEVVKGGKGEPTCARHA